MSGFTRSPKPSPRLRQQYLKSLEEPQEFFLEELVSLGNVWTNEDGSYGVISGKSLVEFFSPDPKNSTKLLCGLHERHGFSTALVKSYDHNFMGSCQKLGWKGSVGGLLFRKRENRIYTAFKNAEISAAMQSDVKPLWEINDGFFESQDEIAALANTGKLWTVRVDAEIVGCGVSNRFFEDSDAVDIGMMVGQCFRRRGLGTHIVSEIANRIEKAGLRPICGCGVSNAASKATLEKAGFVSEHQLISFAV
ncbi:RimJ/RimL family protein N-acetyltransferase [Litoreibacter halocynthiae]|uniref:RimJ/RimL family protein N-acetyltransferase n=1 Tax=Litoreibacter halocynthiae TaxID=1242689 RepID=A0A4R7LEB6_9RHOB|nr:GNAT family N-acetyltransferase [Litoreibacter halocynthiae]TDT73973.1 RimJ/RimL family protein N-acetyltransferase [Litoreibacter halocynthiae]